MMEPKELRHPSFYEGGYSPDSLFPEDYHFYTGQNREQSYPWMEGQEKIRKLIKEWQELKPAISGLFGERKAKDASRLMTKGCALFLQFLFWSNGRPVCMEGMEEKIDELQVKPVNVGERLQFILSHLKLYHSFLQLGELFVEQEKAYAKYLVIKNRAF